MIREELEMLTDIHDLHQSPLSFCGCKNVNPLNMLIGYSKNFPALGIFSEFYGMM